MTLGWVRKWPVGTSFPENYATPASLHRAQYCYPLRVGRIVFYVIPQSLVLFRARDSSMVTAQVKSQTSEAQTVPSQVSYSVSFMYQ